jgi:hypothetical protein
MLLTNVNREKEKKTLKSGTGMKRIPLCEACRFAQFIDSQDGLDEIMDITLSQRKLKSADLANRMASAGAIKLPAAASTRPGNFSVLENVRGNAPPVFGVAPFTLEEHKSAPLVQVPGKLSVGLPTPEFKVPKAMVPSTIASAGNGNLNSCRSMGLSTKLRMASDVEVSTGFSSKALLSQELQENSKVNLRKLASENETMNAAMTINESLQLDSNKPDSSSTLQEKSEADTNKSSEKIVEKVNHSCTQHSCIYLYFTRDSDDAKDHVAVWT